MKNLKLLIVVSILFSSTLPSFLYAQTEGEAISRDEWLEQMKNEELKITAYVNEQMKNTALNESIKQSFMNTEKHEEIKESDLLQLADKYIQDYYRKKYFELYPKIVKIYNPGRAYINEISKDKSEDAAITNILCSQGDFEAGLLTSYTGYRNTGYFSGNCTYVPFSSVSYTNVGFLNPDNFLLTNNVADPNIPILKQTHNGSNHAIRINSFANCSNYGINMLQKSFSSSLSGKVRINFSYALVMQNPPQHDNGNSFFVARVLNNSGVEIGNRICYSANDASVGFQYTTLPEVCSTGTVNVAWKDWTCGYIEFDYIANKTYTIEFFVSSCAWKLHYAYAYIDDICADVSCCQTPTPINLDCTPLNDGSKLSWDPVPGAAYYKVQLNQYDPECCPRINNPNTISEIWNTTNTDLTVPNTFAYCFSWSVQAVMADSCISPSSGKKCSCTPPPPPPDNLGCDSVLDGNYLSWDPVAGAAYYKVYLNQYDPECCNSRNQYPITDIWNTSNTNITVPTTFAYCFSWTVVTVMPDSAESNHSVKKCSCNTLPPPDSLKCDSIPNASKLSWTPVPGAAYYKVYLNQDDPACCQYRSSYPISEIWNTPTASITVPNIFADCFSWWVVAVMPDSSLSPNSDKKCSCTPPKTGSKFGENSGNKTINGKEIKISVIAIPNPASEYIEFEVHSKVNPNSTNSLTLYLFDIKGREVIKKDIADHDKLRLNIQPYPSGVYIYEIKSTNKTLFKDKLVIKKQ